MQPNENNIPSNKKNQNKHRKHPVFLLILVTLFLTSFSATAFILVKTNELTFAGGSIKELQQEVQDLKTELARKNSEIEELKVKVGNADVSGSSFTGSTTTSSSVSTPKKPVETSKPTAESVPVESVAPTSSPDVTIVPQTTPAPQATDRPSETSKPTESPKTQESTEAPQQTVTPDTVSDEKPVSDDKDAEPAQ